MNRGQISPPAPVEGRGGGGDSELRREGGAAWEVSNYVGE